MEDKGLKVTGASEPGSAPLSAGNDSSAATDDGTVSTTSATTPAPCGAVASSTEDSEIDAFLARAREQFGAATWNELVESAAAEAAIAADEGKTPSEQLPRQIGRFTIERLLGEGGHGIVLLAHDPVLGRRVALKLPHLHAVFSPAMRQRFAREAQATARLNHPHIVPVYESGWVGTIGYIASGYCAGPSLEAWLKARCEPVGIRQAVEWVIDLARAVDYAHSQGVVHRDLKPGNVLLEPLVPRGLSGTEEEAPPTLDATDPAPAEAYRVRLTDFGLARLSDTAANATRTGAVIGTPGYMAPEQAVGNLKAIGPATDVYGLGALLLELLTGRPPSSRTGGAGTGQELFAPLSIRRLRRETPVDLEAIALKCLETTPERRYSTAAALADDLERFLRGEVTQARPLGPVRRLARWARRRPWQAAFASTCLAFVALGSLGGAWHVVQLEEALARTRAAEEQSLNSLREKRFLIYQGDLAAAHAALARGDGQMAAELLMRQVPGRNESDLRGFTWRWLWGQCHEPGTPLGVHPGPVYGLAVSPSGERLASCGAEGVIRVWRLPQGELLHELTGHQGDVNEVAFVDGEHHLVSGGDDGTLRHWQLPLEPGQPAKMTVWARQREPVNTLAVTADRQRVLYTADDWFLAARRASDGAPLWRARAHYDEINTLAVSPVAEQAISVASDGATCVWDHRSGRLLATLDAAGGRPLAVAYAPDGRTWAVADVDGHLTLHESQSRRLLWSRMISSDRLEQVLFAGDGATIWAADREGFLNAIATATGERRRSIDLEAGRLWAVTQPDVGKTLVVAGESGWLRRVDPRRGPYQRLGRQFDLHADHLVADGRRPRLACIPRSPGHFTWLWPGENRSEHLPLSVVDHPVSKHVIGLSHSGNLFACSTPDDEVTVWDTVRQETKLVLKVNWVSREALAFSPDERWLALGLARNPKNQLPPQGVIVFDLENGRPVVEFDGAPPTATSVRFSMDGSRLAVGTQDGRLHLWRTSDWVELASPQSHRGWVSQVEFAPGDAHLATISGDRCIRLWDPWTLAPSPQVLRHPDDLRRLRFVPDEPFLLSSCRDGRVRLWSVLNGSLVFVFFESQKMVHNSGLLEFGPGGCWLVGAGFQWEHLKPYHLLLWRAPPLADLSTGKPNPLVAAGP